MGQCTLDAPEAQVRRLQIKTIHQQMENLVTFPSKTVIRAIFLIFFCDK